MRWVLRDAVTSLESVEGNGAFGNEKLPLNEKIKLDSRKKPSQKQCTERETSCDLHTQSPHPLSLQKDRKKVREVRNRQGEAESDFRW